MTEKNYQICSDNDLTLTLTYFMTNMVPWTFEWEKGKIMHSRRIVVENINVDISRYQYSGERSLPLGYLLLVVMAIKKKLLYKICYIYAMAVSLKVSKSWPFLAS